MSLLRLVVPVVEHAVRKPDRLWLRGRGLIKIAARTRLYPFVLDELRIDQELVYLELSLALAHGWLPLIIHEGGYHCTSPSARPGNALGLRSTV